MNRRLEKKHLNSKTTVIYDQDQEKITEIKGLVMHRNAAGETLYQLLDRKNAVTFRRRPQQSGTVQADGTPSKPKTPEDK